MYQTYRKGQIAVIKVQLRAAEKGYVVAFPTTEARYDILLDDGKQIVRVQVKYGGTYNSKKVKGVAQVDLRKSTRGCSERRPYSKEEVDVVLVYLPQVEKIVWLDSDHFDLRASISLRFEKSKNNQQANVNDIDGLIW